jgi:hypothetical protein
MKKNWYNILPWIALVSGFLLVLLVIAAIVFKPQSNFENTENKKIAFDKIKQISLESKGTFNSKAFFDYVDSTILGDPINTIWIITEKGVIVYAKGIMAASTPVNTIVQNSINYQNRGLINAVDGSLDTIQKQVISIAAAIRNEGEHNDVFGHLVIPLKSNRNELAGYIGVAYSLNNSKPELEVYIIEIAIFICFFLYWLSMPVWVYFDSRNRNDRHILWTMFVLIGNLPAYIAYLISRK